MSKPASSNLSGSTTQTPVFTGVCVLSAPSKTASAPKKSTYNFEFMVEGPKPENIEMLHKINCVTCNGDITKRWYVEYYIAGKQANKTLRKREYGFVNKSKDPDKRFELLQQLKQRIIADLELSEGKKLADTNQDNRSITWYLNKYLEEKSKVLEYDSFRTYKRTLKSFHKFLLLNNLSTYAPSTFTKSMILDYRSFRTKTVSNRSVNNDVSFVKSFFEYLINDLDGVLLKNPCTSITQLQSKSEKNIAYTKEQAEQISEYLKIHDKPLLSYCRFVAYAFLRCKETRFLKIGDIDFDRRVITLPAKNAKTGRRAVKPILNIFYEYLKELELHKYPSDYYVFSARGVPGIKPTWDNFFSIKYKPIKKKFGLSSHYTIYSFRHTFVCDLLDSGASWHEIMKYTGHTTFAAFEKYARAILNRPAVDLSANISINF